MTAAVAAPDLKRQQRLTLVACRESPSPRLQSRALSEWRRKVVAGPAMELLAKSQQRFVDQHFKPRVGTPEELEKQGREFYVSRDELFAAHQRLADKTTKQADLLHSLTRFLNYGYNKYVHGGYGTAMELYRGDERRFMLREHDSPSHRCVLLTALAAKLYELLVALSFMTCPQKREQLFGKIRQAIAELDASGEQTRPACAGIR